MPEYGGDHCAAWFTEEKSQRAPSNMQQHGLHGGVHFRIAVPFLGSRGHVRLVISPEIALSAELWAWTSHAREAWIPLGLREALVQSCAASAGCGSVGEWRRHWDWQPLGASRSLQDFLCACESQGSLRH